MYKAKGIISTGFFRTGSTFFFSCLRQVEDLMCFYEPYHPELLSYVEAERMGIHKADKNSLGHTLEGGYFEEYTQLDFEEFSKVLCNQNRATNHPVLIECSSAIALQQYIGFLISGAESCRRVPVLQANRFNLAIPWIKSRFPDYLTVLITRDPWKIFCSLKKLAMYEGRKFDYTLKHDNFWNVSEFFWNIVLGFCRQDNRLSSLNYYQQLYFGCRFCEKYMAQSVDFVFDADRLRQVGEDSLSMILSALGVNSTPATDYFTEKLMASHRLERKPRVFLELELEVDEIFSGDILNNSF